MFRWLSSRPTRNTRSFSRQPSAGPDHHRQGREIDCEFRTHRHERQFRFDRYYYGGDKTALSPTAIRGLAVFKDKEKGNCSPATPSGKSTRSSPTANTITSAWGQQRRRNYRSGRYAESKAELDRGAFKTPSLRNVGQSAPYRHDGSLKTLKDVVDFYKGGGN